MAGQSRIDEIDELIAVLRRARDIARADGATEVASPATEAIDRYGFCADHAKLLRDGPIVPLVDAVPCLSCELDVDLAANLSFELREQLLRSG